MATILISVYVGLGLITAIFLSRPVFKDDQFAVEFAVAFFFWALVFWPVMLAGYLYVKFWRKDKVDERS